MAKSEYNPQTYPDWAWSLAVQGKTIKEIGDAMGVSRATVNRWIADNPEFKEAVNQGRDSADAKVERSLYQRATGYTYKERKIVNVLDSNGKPIPARIETTEKHVPPDTTAQIYWLKNRQRDRWKDKWEVDVSTDKEIVFNIVGASGREVDEK